MNIKDRMLLISTGVISSILAWIYWHYIGVYGDRILLIGIVIAQFLENRQLKKKVTELHLPK